MSFTQVKPFNQAQGGTTPNMCLANTTKGYGIPNRYASAWQAWENTQQHGGDAPGGLDVPVYFSYYATIDGQYKNWGHIGVRLSNGQFWSDGKVYSSVGAYTSNHSPKYVGWGESVNNVTVIKGEETMSPNALNALAQAAWNKDASDPVVKAFINAYNGRSPEQATTDILRSDLNKDQRNKAANYPNLEKALKNAYAMIDKLKAEGQGAVTQQEIDALVKKADDLEQAIKAVNK